MKDCRLDLEVSALTDRVVFDKGGNRRYVLPGHSGSIIGWDKDTIDVLWKIPKAFGGYYEILEVRVNKEELEIHDE